MHVWSCNFLKFKLLLFLFFRNLNCLGMHMSIYIQTLHIFSIFQESIWNFVERRIIDVFLKHPNLCSSEKKNNWQSANFTQLNPICQGWVKIFLAIRLMEEVLCKQTTDPKSNVPNPVKVYIYMEYIQLYFIDEIYINIKSLQYKTFTSNELDWMHMKCRYLSKCVIEKLSTGNCSDWRTWYVLSHMQQIFLLEWHSCYNGIQNSQCY